MRTSGLARRLGMERLEDRRVLAAFSVDTHLDVVNAGDGLTSLREAINAANAATDADVIDFEPTLFGATIQLQTGSALVITNDVTIVGLGADDLTVRGAGSSVFVIGDSDFIGAPKNVTISGLKITGGSSSFGAGIRSTENLTLIDSVVTANVVSSTTTLGVGSYGGAGIWASSSFGGGATPITTTIVRCEISNNEVMLIPDGGAANPSLPGYNGGGIFARDTLVVVDSAVTNNRAGQGSPGLNASPAGAGGDGGGVYSTGPTTITGSTITGNFAGKGSDAPTIAFIRNGGAGGDGGGVAALGSLSISNSVINGNFAGAAGVSANGASGKGGSGGGVYFSGGAGTSLSIVRTTIDGNAATSGATSSGLSAPSSDGGDGGGVWASGVVSIDSSTVSNNTAGNGGGARFSGAANHAGHGGDGGGLWLSGSGAKSFLNSTISGNASGTGGADVPGASSGHGGDGGGIWIGGTGAITIALTTIADNETGVAGATAGGLGGGNIGSGGGAFHAGTATAVQINNSIIAGNRRGAASATASSDLAGPGSIATRYSMIGVSDGATIANNGGNKIGTVGSPLDAELDSLADNGGVTLTHAILPGSPALDAGDSALAAGVGGTPTYDQRGEPYGRVFGVRIDMGSFESLDDGEPTGDSDFDNDSDTDGNDFLLWQRGTGDADSDGDSDGADLSAWRQGFGSVLVLPSAAPLTSAVADSHATRRTGGQLLEMLAGLEPAAAGSHMAEPPGNVSAREKFWGLIEQQRIPSPSPVARSSPCDPLRESKEHRAQADAEARAAAFDDLSFSGLELLGPVY